MPYIIDGHNLISKLSHIDLEDPDDETRLIDLLGRFSHRTGKKIIVYFDQASRSLPPPQSRPGVSSFFISGPRTADDAILSQISRLGRDAGNWTIVSSDREIQSAAEHARARWMRSEDFAPILNLAIDRAESTEADKPEHPLSKDEIEAWEDLFNASH
jgi:predicted RNA-binding protein with PIN domain